MERLTHVHDYTGNQIFFDQFVLDDARNSIELSNDQHWQAVKTISAPPLIIELNNSSPVRFYFSAFEVGNFLVLGVKFRNGMWNVNEYFENPSPSFVHTLIKQYLKGGNINIYLEDEVINDEMETLLKSLL